MNSDFVFCLSLISVMIVIMMVLMFRVKPTPNFDYSRLYFAAGVLAFIGFIFILAMLLYSFDKSPTGTGKEIFDACVKVIPPIITLIIGFYFGTAQRVPESSQPPTGRVEQKQ